MWWAVVGKMKQTIFLETSCAYSNNSPHGKFHRFLFPLSSKFPDLNLALYVLYKYSCYETRTWHKQGAWVSCGLRGRGGYTQAFSKAGKAKETREKGTKKNWSVCGRSFSSPAVPLSLVFFLFTGPRASPAYIKGKENECYAGSQIHESKSCIRLTV